MTGPGSWRGRTTLAAGLVVGVAVTTALGVLPLAHDRAPQGAPPPGTGAERSLLQAPVLQPPDASALDDRGAVQDAQTSAEAPGAAGRAGGAHGLLACPETADGLALCRHGTEPPPPGVDPYRLPTVAQLRARRFGAGVPAGQDARGGRPATAGTAAGPTVTPEEVARTGSVPCTGDGTSGPRVQAVYAHASDRPNRYTEVLPLLQQYAADTSHRINQAAGTGGQGRVVRFVTAGSAPCVLDVANTTLSPAGDDSFTNMVGDLRARGYNRADRKYLVWMDAAVGICGIAHVYRDDRPTRDNLNTRGNMFARTDAPCWNHAELHELLHTLGAVQDSSGNSTKAGHCSDETDAMCYQDSSGSAMRQVCTNAPVWNVDCRLDDYFNPSPDVGSYLAQHWNVADNPYLQEAEPPPPPPDLAISSADRAFAGNAWPVSASPELPPGRSVSSFAWTTTRSDCGFDDPTAPRTRYWCPVTAAGDGRVRAWLRDSAGMEVTRSEEFRLAVPTPPRGVSLSLGASTTSVTAGATATLRVRLTDAQTGTGVIGMPVSLYRRPAGQSGWEKIATRPTTQSGRSSFVVKPARTTEYQVVSGGTSTWASGSGRTRRINVTG